MQPPLKPQLNLSEAPIKLTKTVEVEQKLKSKECPRKKIYRMLIKKQNY